MEVTSLNINKSEIARELNVDRRTVSKYIDGFQKSTTRNRENALTEFYQIIQELLKPDNPQIFYYKRVLHQYLKDNHGYTGSYRNFCGLLNQYPEFENYFKKKNPSNVNQTSVRYETPAGKQAQIDWKESMDFMWTPALGRKEKIMKLKRNALLLICFFACSFMLAADPANGQKKIAQNFFGAANQPYAELVDEENDDLYFLGKTDLLFCPTYFNPRQEFEHWVFEKELPNLDDFDLADDIDFRSCDDTNGGSYTILKSGGVILIKKAGRNYMKFSFKEKFSANL